MFSKGCGAVMGAVLLNRMKPTISSNFDSGTIKSEEVFPACQFDGGEYSSGVRRKSGTMPISLALIIFGLGIVIPAI